MIKKIVGILLIVVFLFGIYFLHINMKEKHILNKNSQNIAEKIAIELRGTDSEITKFKKTIKPKVLKELTEFNSEKNIYFEDEKSCKPIENEIVVCLTISKNENQRILNVTIWENNTAGKGKSKIEPIGSFNYVEE